MTFPRPLVTVVMSTYQAAQTVMLAVRSILRQTYPNWELLLVDDGSTDGTVKLVQTLSDQRIIRLADGLRLGLATRLNQGVAAANGELIARMDADDVCFPNRFEQQVRYLSAHRDVDLVATSALMVDDRGKAIGILPVKTCHDDICLRPWQGFPMPHPTWMGRTAWFRRNPYDPTARKAQDQKLLYAAYRDSRFAGIAAPLLAYRYSRLSLRKTIAGRYHFLRALRSRRNVMHLAAGTSAHAVAAARDVLAMALGQDQRVIRRRVLPPSPRLVAEWEALREQLGRDEGLDLDAHSR